MSEDEVTALAEAAAGHVVDLVLSLLWRPSHFSSPAVIVITKPGVPNEIHPP